MSSLLVKFFNKNLKDEIADPIQLDSSSDILSLTNLLNMILARDSGYIFYYKSERIHINLESIVGKHKLNGEEVIEIGYVDERDIKSDYELECNDTVIGLELYNNELYYLEFNGTVFSKNGEFKYDSNRIKGLFSGSTLFGFSENAIFDLIGKKEVYRFEQKIRSASFDTEHSLMAVSTTKAVYCIDYARLMSSNPPDCILDSVKVNGRIARNILISIKTMYWIEGHNKIVAYDVERKSKKIYSCIHSLNSFVVCNPGMLFATTSNQKIVKFCENQEIEFDACSRLSSHLIYHNDKVIYSTQHEVVSLDAKSMNEISFFKAKGQINSLVASGSMLYIANDNRIDGVNV